MITRDTIITPHLPVEEVYVAEWGGVVRVRGLTARERDAYEASLMSAGRVSWDNARAKLVVRCLVDAQGQRLLSDTDAEALGGCAAHIIDRLFAVASRLSGLTAQDVETLAGNSGGGGDGSSPSPSP